MCQYRRLIWFTKLLVYSIHLLNIYIHKFNNLIVRSNWWIHSIDLKLINDYWWETLLKQVNRRRLSFMNNDDLPIRRQRIVIMCNVGQTMTRFVVVCSWQRCITMTTLQWQRQLVTEFSKLKFWWCGYCVLAHTRGSYFFFKQKKRIFLEMMT